MSDYRRKAKDNGLMAEERARPLILSFFDTSEEELDFVNMVIDYILRNRIPIEVKSCQKWVRDESKSTGRRRGRFVLDRDQHEELIRDRGYYLFMVFDGNELFKFKFIRANKIEFKRSLNWKKLLGAD